MCIYVQVWVPVSLYVHDLHAVSVETRRGHQNPWKWSLLQNRTTHTHNHLKGSPVLILFFLFLFCQNIGYRLNQICFLSCLTRKSPMHSFILNVFVYTTALRSEKISYLLFDKKNFANIYLLFILLFYWDRVSGAQDWPRTCYGEEKAVKLLIPLPLPSRS